MKICPPNCVYNQNNEFRIMIGINEHILYITVEHIIIISMISILFLIHFPILKTLFQNIL